MRGVGFTYVRLCPRVNASGGGRLPVQLARSGEECLEQDESPGKDHLPGFRSSIQNATWFVLLTLCAMRGYQPCCMMRFGELSRIGSAGAGFVEAPVWQQASAS